MSGAEAIDVGKTALVTKRGGGRGENEDKRARSPKTLPQPASQHNERPKWTWSHGRRTDGRTSRQRARARHRAREHAGLETDFVHFGTGGAEGGRDSRSAFASRTRTHAFSTLVAFSAAASLPSLARRFAKVLLPLYATSSSLRASRESDREQKTPWRSGPMARQRSSGQS